MTFGELSPIKLKLTATRWKVRACLFGNYLGDIWVGLFVDSNIFSVKSHLAIRLWRQIMLKEGRRDAQHNDTQHSDTQHNDTHQNDTQHSDTIVLFGTLMTLNITWSAVILVSPRLAWHILLLCWVTLCWVSLCAMTLCWEALCLLSLAEWQQLRVVILDVVMLSVIILDVVMLSVVMLSVAMLNDVMLSVVAPKE